MFRLIYPHPLISMPSVITGLDVVWAWDPALFPLILVQLMWGRRSPFPLLGACCTLALGG